MNKNIKVDFDYQKFKNKKVYKIALVLIIVVVIAAYLLLTGIYTVDESEKGVVTTFGKVTNIVEPGIHLKIPFGVQKVSFVEVNRIKNIEIGYRSSTEGDNQTVDEESKMITGDFNIVSVDFFIEYRIVDPEKYLFSADEPEKILKSLIQSQIRNVIGSYEIDPVLTSAKDQIQAEIKELTIKELENYDIGLKLEVVRIQDSEPPNDEVNAAFMAVKNAESAARTAYNNALAYKNTKEAEANTEANRILENARYLKTKRINEGNQEIALFNAMYDEYINNTDITKARMYYEAIEKILPGMKIYIDTSENGVTKLLPLESIMGGE